MVFSLSFLAETPSPQFIYITAAATFCSIILQGLVALYNYKTRKKEQIVAVDDFWFKKIVFPAFFKPAQIIYKKNLDEICLLYELVNLNEMDRADKLKKFMATIREDFNGLILNDVIVVEIFSAQLYNNACNALDDLEDELAEESHKIIQSSSGNVRQDVNKLRTILSKHYQKMMRSVYDGHKKILN